MASRQHNSNLKKSINNLFWDRFKCLVKIIRCKMYLKKKEIELGCFSLNYKYVVQISFVMNNFPLRFYQLVIVVIIVFKIVCRWLYSQTMIGSIFARSRLCESRKVFEIRDEPFWAFTDGRCSWNVFARCRNVAGNWREINLSMLGQRQQCLLWMA